MPIPSGTKLGPYEVLSLLGAGGMGEVYKAWDPKLDRFVAIKVLPEFWQRDSTFLARFEREAKVLASLNHPNIVGIFDFGEVEGRSYAVMELLEGRTLRQALAGGPLPPRQAAAIGSRISLGLAAAHQAGVIHRDLKPENVFLTGDGRVKLLDFGLAKKVVAQGPSPEEAQPEFHPTSTNAGVLMGTVGYMAPEQLQPDGTVDGRSDLFALGCVLYEMLTGAKAFASETPMGTLHAILTQDPDLERADVPPPFRELLKHCLEKQPAARFQNAQDLSYILQAISRPNETALAAEAPSQRRGWRFAGALALGAVAAALGFWAWRPAPALPSFTPLSQHGGQVYAARFTGGEEAVFTVRKPDGPSEVLRTQTGDASLPMAGFQGLIPLARFPDGGWLLLRGERRLANGRERLSGDLLRSDAQGGHLETLADGVSGADASPDGTAIAAVRRVDGKDRLEAPLGTARAETDGWIGSPRFSPSGRWIAYIDHPGDGRGGAVAVLDLKSGTRRAVSGGWDDLRGLAWSPSGEIWFTASKTGGPRTLFAATLRGRVRSVFSAPESLTIEDISRSGQALISQEHEERAVVARPLTGDPGPVPGEETELLGLSADGQWAAVASPGGSPAARIYRVRLDGGAEAVGQGLLAALSPDGSGAALVSRKADGWHLTLWSPSGTVKAPLPGFSTVHQIAWAPKGGGLLLSGTLGAGGFRVWRMGTDGKDLTPVCPEGISLDQPFLVTPDGRWLLVKAGPLLIRFDLGDPKALPQTLAGISPGERILGWGQDDGHILVVGSRLPALAASMDLSNGSRKPAFPLAAYGHAGALIDTALSAQGGEAFAIGCRETQSRLFLVSGLR